MKAYPLELRQRIVDTYLQGEGSIRQVARRFKVAPSYVQTLLKQARQTGNLQPQSRSRSGPLPKLHAHEQLVRQLVEQHNDATLKELCQSLHAQAGIQVAVSTLHNYLKRLGLTRKKKPSTDNSSGMTTGNS